MTAPRAMTGRGDVIPDGWVLCTDRECWEWQHAHPAPLASAPVRAGDVTGCKYDEDDGSCTVHPSGCPVIEPITDPTIPRGEVHFRDPITGATVGKIVNIGSPLTPVRAEEPTGLCAGRLCDKRWGDGCPDVDPSLETYHLCYTAAGTPCRCSCGSAPPAAAEDADLTALRSEYENVLPLILRPRAHIGVLNYVNALHRERLALLAARDEAREDRDSHQRAAIEAMSAREKADGAWDEAETFIAKLRDPLLHYFGTTDPELLREIWADAAALPTTRRDGA
jgi:hypothetical protein